MFEIKNVKKPLQKPPPNKISNAFKSAMDDDDSSSNAQSRPKISHFGTQIAQVSYEKMLDETSKIVLEDPDVYSYDAHYDEIKEKRQEIEKQKTQKGGSKYISNLMKAADKRKIEQSMIYEKIAEKELAREGQASQGPKYVTSSYKKLMEETRKFQEEDAAKEEYNKKHGAENQENIHGLYKELYNQDLFMGGFRPDLNTMIKQPKAPAPQEKPEAKPEQIIQEKIQPIESKKQPETKYDTEPEQERNPEATQRERPREERESKIRDKSRSRSRSRSKSPSSLTAFREEQKAQEAKKEPEREKEKELSKEEKLKLLKERYQQRKLNQAAGPNPE